MWKLKPDERLARWLAFRKKLDTVTFEHALDLVQDFWFDAPFTPYYLDPEKPETWPDPWTLISENYYCDLAKALGIAYTIYLSKHKPELEIRVYYDAETKYAYNLVLIDKGKYVINLLDDEIVNINSLDKLTLKFKYSSKDLNLDSY